MASSSDRGSRQLAVVLGSVAAVTVVGVGIYYYSRKKKTQRGSSLKGQPPSKSEKKGGKVVEEKTTKPAGPLNKAIALKNKGNECFKASQFDQAIKYYSEAIETCASTASPAELSAFYQNRAAAQEKLENYSAVVEDCTKALEGNKRYVKAVFRRGKAFESMKTYKEALRDFTAACILEGFSNFNTMTSAEQVLKTLSSELAKKTMAERAGRPIPLSKTFVDTYITTFAQDPVLNDVVNSGKSEGGAGDHKEINVVLNGNSAETGNLDGYEKAKYLLKRKQYDDVIGACTEEIELNGKKVIEATLLRATFYLLMGASEPALADFDRLFNAVRDLPPEDNYVKKLKSNIYIKRGSLRMQLGDKDASMIDFQAAEEADPQNGDVYHHRGQLLLLLNEFEKALADFDKAVKLHPDFGVCVAQRCYAKYRHAMATSNASAMHQAMSEFQAILNKHGECVEALALYGQALAEHEDYDEAMRMFDKAKLLAPTNANIYVHKALLEAQGKQGDISSSVRILEQAVQLDPLCEFAYEALGTTELQRGHMDRAMELYQKGIEVSRTEAEMAHLYSLLEAASAQKAIASEFQVSIANMIPGLG